MRRRRLSIAGGEEDNSAARARIAALHSSASHVVTNGPAAFRDDRSGCYFFIGPRTREPLASSEILNPMKLLVLSQYFWPVSFRINEVAKSLQENGV